MMPGQIEQEGRGYERRRYLPSIFSHQRRTRKNKDSAAEGSGGRREAAAPLFSFSSPQIAEEYGQVLLKVEL